MFFVLGSVIDSTLPGGFNLPYKLLGGLLMAGLVLFVARKMKSMTLRSPIKRESF